MPPPARLFSRKANEARSGLLNAPESSIGLGDHHLLPAAPGNLLRRLERWREASHAYRRALALAGSEPVRKFLSRRIAEVESRN